MLSVEEGSRQAAAVAVRILGGEKAGDIKVPPVRFAAPRFDWRQMQRWGISESQPAARQSDLLSRAECVGSVQASDPRDHRCDPRCKAA